MTINQTPPVSEERTPGAYVAYEYTSIRAPRALESLYQDTYRGFGWIVESTELAGSIRPLPLTSPMHPSSITLKLKRERGIRNRPLVQELQRKAEKSLAQIARLERSKTSTATSTAIGFGIVGSAFLAGSMFSMNSGLIALSIVLGAVGLLLWLGGFIAHNIVKNKRATQVAPLIDREHDILYDATVQASRLTAYRVLPK
ncbi:hypothetical protein ACYX8G_01870 [Microbacterium saperdae]